MPLFQSTNTAVCPHCGNNKQPAFEVKQVAIVKEYEDNKIQQRNSSRAIDPSSSKKIYRIDSTNYILVCRHCEKEVPVDG